MDLLKFLKYVDGLIVQLKAPHALIGAFGMTVHGYHRATNDLDFLIHGKFKEDLVDLFLKSGFKLFHESAEVVQFSGERPVDFLLANREITQGMLLKENLPNLEGVPCLLAEDIIGLKIQAYQNNPRRKLRDLADIQALAEANPNLNWELIRSYADLFNCWSDLKEMKDL